MRVTSKSNQHSGYSNGSALRNHMDSAHGGKFDLHCRGCVELKIKQIQGNSSTAREAPDRGRDPLDPPPPVKP